MSNPRAEALRSAFGCSDRPSGRSYNSQRWQTSSHRRERPYGHGSRIPKQTPKPLSTRDIELPTQSASRTSEEPVQSVPQNSRLDFLTKPSNPQNKKKTFVAMPSRKQWENGYRPAWILSEHQDPPEKYEDGFWTYQNYLKTDEVVLRKRKGGGDKAAAAATQYMNKYSSSKKNKI